MATTTALLVLLVLAAFPYTVECPRPNGPTSNFASKHETTLNQSLLERQSWIAQFGNDGPFHAGIGLATPLAPLGLEEDGQSRGRSADGIGIGSIGGSSSVGVVGRNGGGEGGRRG